MRISFTQKVNDYFDRLENEVKHCPIPSVIINIDESGFIQRPLKNSSKVCVFRKDCNTKPHIDGCCSYNEWLRFKTVIDIYDR